MSVLSLPWFGWMAVTVAGYWCMPGRLREFWLVGVTLAFLVMHAPESTVILLVMTAATYLLTNRDHVSGPLAITAAGGIVALLASYKLQVSGQFTDIVRDVAIPLGLSYYSFRCLHYVIERYKGTIPPQTLEDLVNYLFFLPSMLAGPIHRYPQFSRDRRRKRWDSGQFSEGLERILYGYVKIAFLANFVVSVKLAEFIAGIDPSQTALIAYLDILRHSLNLYFQFSGYSDVAIGFALLLGYRVMENFNWPFLKSNISEFWRSWHISLSSWCREYVYMLVVSTTRSAALGAVSAMLVLGLWHELSLRYVVWGLYHGCGIVVWQGFQHVKAALPEVENLWLLRSLKALSVLLTFHFVIFGFTIVKEPDLGSAVDALARVLLFWM